MSQHVELEVHIQRGGSAYEIDLRLTQPGSDAEIQPLKGGSRPMNIDLDALKAASSDPVRYASIITSAFFDAEVKSSFDSAVAVAQSLEKPLRVRLHLAPNDAALHAIRWEQLTYPGSASPLLMREDVYFSRFLPSDDFRRIPQRPRRELRALLVAASPDDADGRWPQFAHVDASAEVQTSRAALGDTIPASTLDKVERATLDTIIRRLREGFDILYLACHGGFDRSNQPFLLLEDEQGQPVPVPAQEFVLRVSELWQRPRLIVLASCQSAGKGTQGPRADAQAGSADAATVRSDGTPLAAVGPLLAAAGVGAVVAMQGKVTMETVSCCMPIFFRELCRDGMLDRAMAVARAAIRARNDWWMPVLFMRLRSGRIWWYDTGFGHARAEFKRWDGLLGSIRDGRCTPILGPGITDALVGGRRDIARRLAEANHYPMAPHQREDLPQVAQYLAITQDPNDAQRKVLQHLCEELIARYHRHLQSDDQVPEAVTALGRDELASLYERLLQRAWRLRVVDEPVEPHRVLAHIPFPLYITTNPESLLGTAVAEAPLAGAMRAPNVALCQWNEELMDLPSALDGDYVLSRATPLIYHLFGRLDVPRSLVITEDDYFDFLIGVTANKALIPTAVRRALADSALLFLGFQLDDWDFRVLFRSLASQEGKRRRQAYAHIAVQVDPEEGRVQRPDQAREFLNTYFQNADISIYWGTVEDFVKELEPRWRRLAQNAA